MCGCHFVCNYSKYLQCMTIITMSALVSVARKDDSSLLASVLF